MLFLLSTILVIRVSAQDPPFQIVSVTIRDEDRNPITSAIRGQFIFVDIVIRNTELYTYEARPYLIVARLSYGSPPILMGLSGYKGSLAGGEEDEPTPGLQIPSAGPAGTYTITVLTFSDWPALGGVTVAVPYPVSLPVS
ncbi:MAG: hypothetical protein ACUVUS_09725 [Thermoproteota archaeon]